MVCAVEPVGRMTLLGRRISYLFTEQQTRRNLRALSKFLALLVVVVLVYATVFHVLMALEGQRHSWLSGLYWTLVVMSTLGFGDITFQSDAGRAFSLVVVLSGIVLLLIVLPFAFIRYLYAPWLEAQIRSRAPRRLPSQVQDHLIITHYDVTAQGLVKRLTESGAPYVVIEADHARAAKLHDEGISVIVGEPDSKETYVAANAAKARLLYANHDDATNANITLTTREVAPFLAVAALVENAASSDVLELAGATHVLPLKQRLGEQLAARVVAGGRSGQVIGEFEGVLIAEFPVHNTELAGQSLRAARLRERLGVSVIAYWERGHLYPAQVDSVLDEYAVIVVAGAEEQIALLDRALRVPGTNEHPVVVLGGGKVGRATTRALQRRGIEVHMVERARELSPILAELPAQVYYGEASELRVLENAGIHQTPAVVLTTNDDATNIFLALYCHRLNPDARIVSRITHERNLEAIHRSGAVFVLSYARLGVQSVLALYQQRDLVILGEDVELFWVPVPHSLGGMKLEESGIGERTGLNVIGVRTPEALVVGPTGGAELEPGGELILAGTPAQRRIFEDTFGVESSFATGVPLVRWRGRRARARQ